MPLVLLDPPVVRRVLLVLKVPEVLLVRQDHGVLRAAKVLQDLKVLQVVQLVQPV